MCLKKQPKFSHWTFVEMCFRSWMILDAILCIPFLECQYGMQGCFLFSHQGLGTQGNGLSASGLNVVGQVAEQGVNQLSSLLSGHFLSFTLFQRKEIDAPSLCSWLGGKLPKVSTHNPYHAMTYPTQFLVSYSPPTSHWWTTSQCSWPVVYSSLTLFSLCLVLKDCTLKLHIIPLFFLSKTTLVDKNK